MVKHIERGWTLEERKEWYNGSDLWHTLDDEWYDYLLEKELKKVWSYSELVESLNEDVTAGMTVDEIYDKYCSK